MKMNHELRIKIIVLLTLALVSVTAPLIVLAATPTLNPFSPDFKLSVCDGPTLPQSVRDTLPKGDAFKKAYGHDEPYVACDFAGLMSQAQFLINAMIMLGVLAAIVSFSYAGALYLTGEQGKIKQAKGIFKNVGIGFIIMLTAWFIVFQILDWLVGNPGVKSLIGSP